MPLLEIHFAKSTSKKFNEVIRYAKKFPNFEEGNPNVLRFERIDEIFTQWDDFNHLFHVVKTWSGTSVIYGTAPLTPYRKLSEWFYAIQELKYCYNFQQTAYDKKAFCADGGDWSCKRLHSIARFLNQHFCVFWYKYGHFKDKNTWVIEKNQIKIVLIEEAKQKRIDSCPAFNRDALFDQIDLLPDELIIDDIYWKVVYRQDWTANGPLNTPISIEHIPHDKYPISEESFFDEPIEEIKPIRLTEDQMANQRIDIYLREKGETV